MNLLKTTYGICILAALAFIIPLMAGSNDALWHPEIFGIYCSITPKVIAVMEAGYFLLFAWIYRSLGHLLYSDRLSRIHISGSFILMFSGIMLLWATWRFFDGWENFDLAIKLLIAVVCMFYVVLALQLIFAFNLIRGISGRQKSTGNA